MKLNSSTSAWPKKNRLTFLSLVQYNSGDSIITVSIRSKNDSVVLSIANSYPDLHIAKFQALKSFDKYAVCFVGDENEKFYTVTGKMETPKLITEKSDNLYEVGNRPPSGDPL